jgi:selenide,water dikinase
MLTRGDKNNRAYVGNTVEIAPAVSREMQSALFDPQTAGGLLISIESSKAVALAESIGDAFIIGEVHAREDKLIKVV